MQYTVYNHVQRFTPPPFSATMPAMRYIADLHIHSPYSRATSPESTLSGLAAWGRKKGIQVIASGDFTHPAWFNTLEHQLIAAEPGFFRLAADTSNEPLLRFMLSAEISCIYKRHGRTRKVHNLLYVPDLASAARINARLAAIGNIVSDGRPILGLDSRDLLEIVLENAPGGFLVPAHIWTPWFSMLGSKSGFDSVEECFGDLSEHIFALETGLSSDPEMNRLVSSLDKYALISNSDCHSPGKLGREANIFDTDLDYHALVAALRENRRDSFYGTVEFFPEEGKYHFDGHRNCNVCLSPSESMQLRDYACPVCCKPLTIGVHHRVSKLADRNIPLKRDDAPLQISAIPLQEIIAELLSVGTASKEVARQYLQALELFESEFNLLLFAPAAEIAQLSPLLALAIERVRRGKVIRKPGYDGEYGVIKVFEPNELKQLTADVTRKGRWLELFEQQR